MNKFKKMRLKTGLNQTELAKILDIKLPTYSSYEQGKREPKLENLKKIATFYRIPLDELVGYEFDENVYQYYQEKLKRYTHDDNR
ncbi:helix-turn-helix transcriptional regulator [Fructobacillus cardui]|uniref:helix-turn-helix domain-containing protein n=1 Tax=Fructobacillus cardui TaxID=2893170 RepID=UPI0030C8377B